MEPRDRIHIAVSVVHPQHPKLPTSSMKSTTSAVNPVNPVNPVQNPTPPPQADEQRPVLFGSKDTLITTSSRF
jgi:hypothetical protein